MTGKGFSGSVISGVVSFDTVKDDVKKKVREELGKVACAELGGFSSGAWCCWWCCCWCWCC